MNGSKKGELNIRVDHKTRSLMFERDVFAVGLSGDDLEDEAGLKVGGGAIMERMKRQLRLLAGKLHTAALLISPEFSIEAHQRRAALLASAPQKSQEEHEAAIKLLQLGDKKKYARESEAAKQQRDEQMRKTKKAADEQAAEKLRLEDEQKKRERDKLEQMKAQMHAAEQKKLAERLVTEMGAKIKTEVRGPYFHLFLSKCFVFLLITVECRIWKIWMRRNSSAFKSKSSLEPKPKRLPRSRP